MPVRNRNRIAALMRCEAEKSIQKRTKGFKPRMFFDRAHIE